MSKVEPGSKTDAAYARLRSEIERGDLGAGASLSEHALVERLGLSRTPVRDALRRLIDDGLAVRDGSRGSVRVSTPSVAGVHDLFGFRAVLEGAAIHDLADALASGSVSSDPIAGLAEELRGLGEQAPSRERTDAFYDFAERFDRTIIDLTPNRLLAKAIADLRPRTVRLRGVAHHRPEREARSMAEHQAMLAALLAGDGEAAQLECVAHLRLTMEAIFAGLADPRQAHTLAF